MQQEIISIENQTKAAVEQLDDRKEQLEALSALRQKHISELAASKRSPRSAIIKFLGGLLAISVTTASAYFLKATILD
jgi:hypothetical protein